MLPFPSAALMQPAASGGGGSGFTQRQFLLATPNGSVFVNTSITSDRQFALRNGSFLNEQS